MPTIIDICTSIIHYQLIMTSSSLSLEYPGLLWNYEHNYVHYPLSINDACMDNRQWK